MKKLVLLITLVITLSTSVVFAHSGGLDQNGGHYDHRTGQYHYHR